MRSSGPPSPHGLPVPDEVRCAVPACARVRAAASQEQPGKVESAGAVEAKTAEEPAEPIVHDSSDEKSKEQESWEEEKEKKAEKAQEKLDEKAEKAVEEEEAKQEAAESETESLREKLVRRAVHASPAQQPGVARRGLRH